MDSECASALQSNLMLNYSNGTCIDIATLSIPFAAAVAAMDHDNAYRTIIYCTYLNITYKSNT